MGGRPLFALALVAMPVAALPVETIRRVLEGGESACRRAGIPVAGGHSVDAVEPIYGLVVVGVVDPRCLKRNSGAQPGDVVVLGKPLGVGVYGAAVRQQITGTQYRELIDTTTQLNTPGIRLATLAGVHALTDVTGFGKAVAVRFSTRRMPYLSARFSRSAPVYTRHGGTKRGATL